MIPIEGQPILTAARMRAAEERAIAAGSSVEELMERAGAGVAAAVRRLAAGAPVLILCGSGNNGGDGYVAARLLKANGVDVRLAAAGDPKSDAAIVAREAWDGAVESVADVTPSPILVDALFGTGLSRPLDPKLSVQLGLLAAHARLSIAVDLPSGVANDSGEHLGAASVDLTLALGAVKPAHVLYPAAGLCGTVRLIDIGVNPGGDDLVLRKPWLAAPDETSQKYSRGMVAVIAGAMPGAAALAATAALRAGSGYVLLVGDAPSGMPHAIVTKPWSTDVLSDKRIGAIVIGPGLGRDDSARQKLDTAIASPHRLVIDGDALHLLGEADFGRFADRDNPVVLTPHAGEFAALFGEESGSKIEIARRCAKRANAYIAFKGPDTVIAMPSHHGSGDILVSSGGSAWLSTAGTGDVLAGAIGAMLAAKKGSAFHAIGAGVWLHSEAARRLGGAFIADDLAHELSTVRAAL